MEVLIIEFFSFDVCRGFSFPFSSISTGTAVARCSSALRFVNALALDVPRLSSCWIVHSMPFDVRIRLRCAFGSEKTVRPSSMLFSIHQVALSGDERDDLARRQQQRFERTQALLRDRQAGKA